MRGRRQFGPRTRTCVTCWRWCGATTPVERKHLIAQELKPKEIGADIQCGNLGNGTFHQQIVRSAHVYRARTQARSLCGNPALLRNFASCLAASCGLCSENGRTSAARVEGADGVGRQMQQRAKVLTFDSQVKRRPTRGYDLFRQSNINGCLAWWCKVSQGQGSRFHVEYGFRWTEGCICSNGGRVD